MFVYKSTEKQYRKHINSKIFVSMQPKMVVTPASALHHDSTVSEGSDKEEVGSALNDRRGELV